ncbi:MalY/PatB family protein [Acetivibrio ethanolgignens]|uniref:cysteine-S-conjugate beta-lyase n=1 Tax=Acetivibrio ethanolgignens TaxID=290052 RepID=A0A0V8QBP5_9FIRM|nr:MalY/PatB family protein [Acetivibrio ethanolgignens]KSV58024.1 aminotransferase [Acetivibrio ethanolgignens]
MSGKYNFDENINRRGTSCLKYDFGMKRKGREDLLPLWVADMDFKLQDEILEDFHKRIDHGIFGYTDPDEEYYAALDRWFSVHHGYHIEPETVTVGCGVVYGLATGVKAFTEVGDSIIIQQPVYYPFREVIEDNGRRFINNQLHYENGRYTIDFEDFEQKIINNNVKVFILCNPHNPVGRVWTKEELERLGDICLKHNVIIMDDEIHCDFSFPGYKVTSFMTLDKKYQENLVLYTSPSKTFNVAGLQPANIIIKNEKLRAKYRKANAATGYSQGNIMGMLAVKSVYTKGDEWVKELVEYITGNMQYFKEFVKENFPKAHFVEPEGTYLLWVDFSGYGFTDEELDHIMVEEARLWLDSGKIFGPATAQFERFNVACPRATVEQALKQLKAAIDSHQKWD